MNGGQRFLVERQVEAVGLDAQVQLLNVHITQEVEHTRRQESACTQGNTPDAHRTVFADADRNG